MRSASEPARPGRRFRLRLLVAMMIVISGITALSLYVAQRTSSREVERDLQHDFESELAALHGAHEVRQAALAERCRSLVMKPRIHASLEDNALDLLYPSAKDELRDVMEERGPSAAGTDHGLHATFYRFLNADGQVISAPNPADVGELTGAEEASLALPKPSETEQIGYLPRGFSASHGRVDQVITVPIISSETGEVIAALVVGFKVSEPAPEKLERGVRSGVLVNAKLYSPALKDEEHTFIAAEAARAVASGRDSVGNYAIRVNGNPHLLFCKRLNPDSLYPPAYEVSVYPLAETIARQRALRWQILSAGGLLLLGGFIASHFLAGRLSVPVEKLAVSSEENRSQRERAEAALAVTSRELQRSARFSADASHQLKTPVAVLRAGLEELLARDDISEAAREEVSALIHQTYRLGGVIEDLLLLSRMDAGRLRLDLQPLDLCQLIEGWLDDFSALTDDWELDVEMHCPAGVRIAGEKRYTSLILQNLLENARKYNRAQGRIRVSVAEEGEWVLVCVGNTGKTIAPGARDHIFDRFHRGSVGEDVPGHGLGLNLARELARLHGGELQLVRSEDDWTEFEVRFPLAKTPGRSSYQST